VIEVTTQRQGAILVTGQKGWETLHYRQVIHSSGNASFFEWGGQRGAKTFLGGQVYMVAINALPQCH